MLIDPREIKKGKNKYKNKLSIKNKSEDYLRFFIIIIIY